MPNEDRSAERLARLDTCAVSDALDQLGLAGAVAGITALSAPGRIAGRVVTVKLAAGPPAGGVKRHLGASAIDGANPGDVIVIEQSTGIDAACWGGILSQAARLRGISGVVAEGPVRDVDEARSIGFPVYARSATARTARGRIHEVATNEQIIVGGVAVNAGDLVLADATAVVFVPHSRADEVMEAAERIARREAAMVEALRQGQRVSDVMDARYEDMLTEKERTK